RPMGKNPCPIVGRISIDRAAPCWPPVRSPAPTPPACDGRAAPLSPPGVLALRRVRMPVLEGRTTAVDVLIAEDDAPTREGIRRLLEQQGYRGAEAGDGREAWELARRPLPRCVLLDLRMPALDGLAVACQLRADPRTCGAAIHCLTGLTDEGSRRE